MKVIDKPAVPRVIFGTNTHKRIGEVLKTYMAGSCLIITGPSMEKRGYLKMITDELNTAEIAYHVFSDVAPDPSDTCVLEAAKRLKEGNYDAVIGFGGGSPMDVAKAACLIAGFSEEPEEINDLFEYRRGGAKHRDDWKHCYPLVTIPTTAGTGAEATSAAVITCSKSGRKFSFGNAATMADVAIVDPIFTVGTPAKVTASCALDAFCHAAENLVGNAQNEFSNMVMLACIERIWKWLPKAIDNSNCLEAREQLAWAAHHALANGGVPNGHAIGVAIGSVYHMVHGSACIVVLPTVIRHHAEHAKREIAEMAERMNLPVSEDTTKTAETVAEAIKSFYRSVGLPTLREYLRANGYADTAEECAKKLAEAALTDYKSKTWIPPIHNEVQTIESVCAAVYNDT